MVGGIGRTRPRVAAGLLAALIAGTFVFDASRIKRDLGWAPTLSNDEMLREAYRYFASRDTSRDEALSAHRQGAKMGILRLVKWLS